MHLGNPDVLRAIGGGQQRPLSEEGHRSNRHSGVAEQVLQRDGRVRQGRRVSVPALVSDDKNLHVSSRPFPVFKSDGEA